MTKTQISIRRALKDKNWGGILAQDIREKLKEETGVLRPVCGARLTDSAMFALMHDGIPDRKTVEKANDAWEKARQAAKAADDAHSAKEQELLPEKSALMTAAEEHLSVSLCDDLKKGTILPDAVASCDAQIAEARAAFGQAAADMAAKEKALSEKKKKNNRRPDCRHAARVGRCTPKTQQRPRCRNGRKNEHGKQKETAAGSS